MHSAINGLLKILRAHGHPDLPNDSRTLLRTPPKISISEMGTAKYWYYGIQSNLDLVLNSLIKNNTQLKLMFNVAGISPYNSSALECWPILFRASDLKHLKPMVVAAYFGKAPTGTIFNTVRK